jgi:hypothetical protein
LAATKQFRKRRRVGLVVGTLAATAMLVAVAHADYVVNTLDFTIDGTPETMNLAAGGTAGKTYLYVANQNNGDGDTNNSCNLAGDKSLTVDVVSSNPAKATVSPSTVTIDDCVSNTANPLSELSKLREITVTPLAAGSATISVTFKSSTPGTPGTFNTLPATFNVNVSGPADATKPVIVPDVTGTLGANGWYTSDVSVSWSVTDPESGIASSTGCGTTSITSDTAGQTVTCSATNGAGLSDSRSVTIKRDATAPSIIWDPAADSCAVPGTNGWCRGTQTAGFTTSDATSGLASDGAFMRNLTRSTTTNGSSVSIPSGSVSDLAGNTNSGIDATGFKIDSVAPTVACQSPAPAFLLNEPSAQVPATVSDGASLPVNATEYGSANTFSVGSKSVIIAGYDNAGNNASASCGYTVGYRFEGLNAPVDRPNTMNASKAGQAIPLKWRLTDYHGVGVSTLTGVSVSVGSLACTAGIAEDALEEYASGSSGLQNLGDGYYQFNWKTPTTYANSCKQIGLNLGEGSARNGLAYFNFKK